jgi:hypothetical protein
VDERITAHAMGTPHSVIAAKYGITIGSSRDFAYEHRGEVHARRVEIYGDPSDRPDWTAEREELRQETRSVVEGLLLRFHSEDADDRVRNRVARDLYPYFRLLYEAGAFLPQRGQLELEVKTPFTLGDVLALDENGQLHEVVQASNDGH